MTVNLLNPSELNSYIIKSIYSNEEIASFKPSELKDYNFAKENKDKIAKAMMYQWAKLRYKDYLLKNESLFVNASSDKDLPDWAQTAVSEGKSVHSFNASNIPQKIKEEITSVNDFLYAMADKKIKEALNVAENHPQHKMSGLSVDFLKTVNEYDNFEKTVHASLKWHELLALKAESKKKKADLGRSFEGVSLEKDFNDGMVFVRLNTEEALDYEGERMGHCIGSGNYDVGVTSGLKEIYSLRDKSGEAHVTLEILRGQVFQCKGKANKSVLRKYAPYVKEFIKEKNFGFNSDRKYLGYAEDINGSTYDLFDLPKGKNLHFDSIDLSDMGLSELPDMTSITANEFICKNNKLKNLKGTPNVINHIDCSFNPELKSFEGAPEKLDGSFVCTDTGVTSLAHAPSDVTSLNASNSKNLNDLTGAPRKIFGSLDLSGNNLNEGSLAPDYVKDIRYINGLSRDLLDKMVENWKSSQKNKKTIITHREGRGY